MKIARQISVLHVGSVYDGQRRVDLGKNIVAEMLCGIADKIGLFVVSDKGDARALGGKGGNIALVRANVPDLFAREHIALFVDVNRDGIVFFAIEIAIRLKSRDDRDFMLYAFAAEQDGDFHFHGCHRVSSLNKTDTRYSLGVFPSRER